jgi:hypothetical protein
MDTPTFLGPVFGGLSAAAALYGMYRGAKSVSESHTKDMKDNILASVSDAITIGMLKASKEILATVSNEFVPMNTCKVMHASVQGELRTCVERIADCEDAIAAIKSKHEGDVETINREHRTFMMTLAAVAGSVVMSLQLIAEKHPDLPLAKLLASAAERLHGLG